MLSFIFILLPYGKDDKMRRGCGVVLSPVAPDPPGHVAMTGQACPETHRTPPRPHFVSRKRAGRGLSPDPSWGGVPWCER